MAKNITADSASSNQSILAWNGTDYGLCWRDTRDGNAEVYFTTGLFSTLDAMLDMSMEDILEAAKRGGTRLIMFCETGANLCEEYVKLGVPQTVDNMPAGGTTAPVTAPGILALGAKVAGGPFTSGDIALLRTLADQTAVALENARLHEEARRARAAPIRAMT